MQFDCRKTAISQISTHLARNISRQFSAQNCFSWWKSRFIHLFSRLWWYFEGIYIFESFINKIDIFRTTEIYLLIWL